MSKFNPPRLVSPRSLQSEQEPPDNGGMEARVLKLEDFAVETRDRLTRIETKLDATATKSDLADLKSEMHKGFSDMLKWIVGTGFVGMAAMVTVMAFVLNNAVPKAAPQSQVPIIINVPAAAPAATLNMLPAK